MDLTVRVLLLCCGLLCVVSEIWGQIGLSHGLQWTRDIARCPKSLAVMEEAFYSTPSPKVCDAKCRMGPEATEEDNCYYRNGACVQRAREEEVALLYDSCWPSAAPAQCNFSAASGLPVSLNVGYSCLEGIIFDPYNVTFSWKAQKMTLALLNVDSNPGKLVTHCDVNSDSPSPNIKITALKSPSTVPRDAVNVTSGMDDIIVVVNDVRTNVTESRLPYWWIVKEPRFKIEFQLEVTGVDLHPHWISLEDSSMFEVVCRKMDASSMSMTSSKPSIIHETLFVINGKAFTLGDVIGAVVCTVIIILLVVLVVVLALKYRKRHWSPHRRRQQRERDYSNLVSRMEFHNRAAESCVSSVTNCSDVSDSDPFNGRSCPPPTTTSDPEAGRGGGGGEPSSSRYQKGAGISNDTYGFPSGDLDPSTQQTTFGQGAAAADDDSDKLEEPFPLVASQPDSSGEACGGGGGVGKDWERF